MTQRVTIRNVATNEARVYETQQPMSRFWWEDGNGSCDCDRRICWQMAGGEEPDENPPCGDGVFVIEATESPLED